MVCFLRQSYRDTVDQVVDMFDKLLTRTCTQAEHDLDDPMRTQRHTIKAALDQLRSFGVIILDDSIQSSELRAKLFEVVPREELTQQVQGLADWVTGKTSDVFHGIVRRQGYLRQFTPVLLRALEFFQFFPDSQDTDVPCLKALAMLKDLNSNQKRKIPDDAPTDFISKRLFPFVVQDGQVNRAAWECALLLKVQEELKSGNLSVRHSKRFGRFEDYFIAAELWQPQRDSFFSPGGSADRLQTSA